MNNDRFLLSAKRCGVLLLFALQGKMLLCNLEDVICLCYWGGGEGSDARCVCVIYGGRQMHASRVSASSTIGLRDDNDVVSETLKRG